jgi:micrococcal nuclease
MRNVPWWRSRGAVTATVAILAAGAWAWALGTAAASWLWGSSPSRRPGAEPAHVARVVDGDTLVLGDGRTVRLLGVDAPETSNPNMAAVQPVGEEAASRLAELLDGQEVMLERDQTDADHYGRLLRYVWLRGTLIPELLAAEGLAWSSSFPPDTRYRDVIRAAEARARTAGVGVWGVARPTALPVFGEPAQYGHDG